MAKVVWSVPLVQFGKFLIEADEEELHVDVSSPYELGQAYAVWCNLAMQGFEAGKKIDVSPPDVTGQYQESPEKEPRSSHRHKYMWVDVPNGGPSGMFCECGQEEPEPTPEQAESEIKKLGATTVEPWTQTPETKPKAWDNFDI